MTIERVLESRGPCESLELSIVRFGLQKNGRVAENETHVATRPAGAYMFRPNTSELFYPGPVAMPTLEVVEDGMVTEVRQVFSQWASHVVRLYKGAPYVELESTNGARR